MRKIIFRGKRCDNGEWIEGSLVHQTLFYGDETDCYHILYGGEFSCDFYDAEEVIPETIGQYTGLTDKNGKKIFEGDIVQYKDERGEIVYSDSEAMFCVSFNDWYTDFDHLCGKDVEVIGIIHDTPETLEVSEDG